MRRAGVWTTLGVVVAMSGGCVTTSKLEQGLTAAKKELRAENEAQNQAQTAALDQKAAALEQKIDVLRRESATKAALDQQVAAIKQELAAVQQKLTEATQLLNEKIAAVDEKSAAQLQSLHEELSATSALASQMGQVRDKYLSTLEWEVSAMEQRLRNLKNLIAELKGGAAAPSTVPAGTGTATQPR